MNPTSNLFVVGLTGKNAAGKSLVGRVLERLGYTYVSLSDVVRAELAARGLPASRENLISVANELRRRDGPAVLAARTVAAFHRHHYVVDSIRSPVEIETLRTSGRFVLIGVDAPIGIRFARAQARGRDESAHTIEEFERIEARERTTNPDEQQLDEALKLADRTLMNDADPASLERAALGFLRERGFPTDPAAIGKNP